MLLSIAPASRRTDVRACLGKGCCRGYQRSYLFDFLQL
jgi:hypothetical protein